MNDQLRANYTRLAELCERVAELAKADMSDATDLLLAAHEMSDTDPFRELLVTYFKNRRACWNKMIAAETEKAETYRALARD